MQLCSMLTHPEERMGENVIKFIAFPDSILRTFTNTLQYLTQNNMHITTNTLTKHLTRVRCAYAHY